MKIDIETNGLELDRELNHFVMCCAGFELGPQRNRIESVQVHLIDAAGSRGRKLKHCLVEARMSDGHPYYIREEDMDMHVAVYRALERTGQMVTSRESQDDSVAGQLPQAQPRAPSRSQPNLAA